MRWIVTCAWPYINAVPHLGTLVQLVSADVYARCMRKLGEEVLFVSGSDEHGTPIEVEALKRGISPKDLTDRMHRYFCKLIDLFGISFDNYTRTESPVHIKFVQDFYLKVQKNGYIFVEESEQLFCPEDEMFLPDRFVEGTCPYCGYEKTTGDQCEKCGRLLTPTDLINPRCAICGSSPKLKKTKHWYFDLPRFEGHLRSYIEKHEALPQNAKSMSLSMIDEGLRSRAVTRDNRWGIPAPFPGSEGKTIYVWMEAVLGYVSAVKEYFERRGCPEKFDLFWKDPDTRSVYFIGKDNIPFHTIILPALLMASQEGYVLPYNVSSTEFLNYEGDKFSKRFRRGIWMDEALLLLEADYWRYYIISTRPENKDANFTWEDFEAKINNELNDVLGNFVHRVMSFLASRYNGIVPNADLDEESSDFLERCLEVAKRSISYIERFMLKEALKEAMSIAREGNRFFNEREPWRDVKVNRSRSDTTLIASTQAVKIISHVIEPFLPFTAEKLWRMLNLEGDPHSTTFDDMRIMLRSGHTIGYVKPLFEKVSAEELKTRLERIRREIKSEFLLEETS